MNAQIAVIADDLSGGNGVGFEFANLGFRTCLIQDTQSTSQPDADVVICDTETRLSSKALAYKKVRNAADHIHAPVVVKKIDSLLRGNVGTEIKAILDSHGHNHVLVLTASPQAGRTMVGGYQLVYGNLLVDDNTVDPSSAVQGSYVPTLLEKDLGETVGLLPIGEILTGKESFINSLQGLMESNRVIVADATKQEHLNEVVSISYSLGIHFFAGTYGIGEAVGRLLQTVKPRGGCILTVASSLSDVTRHQVSFAQRDARIRLVSVSLPWQFTEWDEARIASCYTSEIIRGIEDGFDVLIYTASNRDDVQKTMNLGQQLGISQEEVEHKLARIIERLVRPVLPRVRGLVLTGGSTAQAVFRLLDASGIHILPYEVVTSAPAAKVLDGPYKGLLFLTKPGAYGQENALSEMIQYARNKEEDR